MTPGDEQSKESVLVCKESAKEVKEPTGEEVKEAVSEEAEKDDAMCTDESAELTIVTEGEEISNNPDSKEKTSD